MIPKNNEVRFEITNRCMYNCVMCPREKLTRPLKTMRLDTFKKLLNKVLKETNQYEYCTFSGFGEPLLDKSLLEKIKYARSVGLKVLLLTNGYLLTPDLFGKLDKLGVESVRVSLYGNSPEIYSNIHRSTDKDAFKKVLYYLTTICAMERNTKVILNYLVDMQINDKDMQGWISYWDNKADLIEVWQPHNWSDGKNYRKIQENQITCNRIYRGPLQIQVDGTVNVCCFDFNGNLTIGDFNTQTLEEIFNSNAATVIKDYLQGTKTLKLNCETCDQRNANKDGIMIYNSKLDIKERVNQVSTTYGEV